MSRLVRKLSSVLLVLFIVACLPSLVRSQETSHIDLGTAEYGQENFEEALKHFLKAREEAPSSSQAAFLTGLTYKQIEDYVKAAEHLKDAITLTPMVNDALLELAEVYNVLDRTDEALDTIAIAEREGVRPADTHFLKGLILIKAGRNTEALESFSKAKDLEPGLLQAAEYQMGIIYVRQGKLMDAKEIFQELIVRDPNTDMALFAHRYTQSIEDRLVTEKPFKLSVGVAYQMDDNVVLLPSDAGAAAGVTDEEDDAMLVTASMDYNMDLAGPWSMKARYSLYVKNYEDLNTHDVQSHSATLVPSYVADKGLYSFTMGYNHTWVDNDEYLSSYTFAPSYLHLLDDNKMLLVGVRYRFKEYMLAPLTSDEDRDASDYAVQVGYFYFFADTKGMVSLKYELNKEDTDGTNWEYTGNRGTATVVVPLSEKLKLSLSADYFDQQFSNPHTSSAFNGRKRTDRTTTATAFLGYHIKGNTELQLSYTNARGDSNFATYDYSRGITTMGIEYKY